MVPNAVDAAVRQAVDTRIAGVVRSLEQDRAAVPHELRQSIALTVPGVVADTVGQSLPSMVSDAVEAALPALVAEALREAVEVRAFRERPPEEAPSAPRPIEHDPVISARQRSMEKRLDGLTRRAQEIDDRISTHLRGIDDDRQVLSDVVRHQDRLAQSLAEIDLAGQYDQLSAWVTDSVPSMVASAVQSALDAQSAAITTALSRAERARADTQAMHATVQASSERILEALYRRDQQIDDRAGSSLAAFEQERAALTELLEDNRERVEQSVLAGLPVLVNSAVRVAMEAYRSERRSGVEELAARIKADSEVMRDGLQRSFEKMMEALANREQELDERAAAHRRALDHEKGETAELWAKAAKSLTDALPGMVAEAVKKAGEVDRSELASVLEGMSRLREESETAAAEPPGGDGRGSRSHWEPGRGHRAPGGGLRTGRRRDAGGDVPPAGSPGRGARSSGHPGGGAHRGRRAVRRRSRPVRPVDSSALPTGGAPHAQDRRQQRRLAGPEPTRSGARRPPRRRPVTD